MSSQFYYLVNLRLYIKKIINGLKLTGMVYDSCTCLITWRNNAKYIKPLPIPNFYESLDILSHNDYRPFISTQILLSFKC